MSRNSGRPRRRAVLDRLPRRLWIVAAAVVAAAVVAVSAALLLGSDDRDTTAVGPSPAGGRSSLTTTTRSSTTSSTVGPATTSTTPESTSPPGPPASSTGTIATTTPPSTGPPATAPRSRCVGGWTVPEPGTDLRTTPLDLIRRDMRIAGEFLVTEMRYFTGPEVPWILWPRREVVEWWYVKAQLAGDPAFRARWLVVRRSPVVAGMTAVAPFDTHGYRSPDWRGFLGEGEPYAIEGLPGTYIGMNYDFLVGEDGEKPGLPDEVVGCLDGT